MSDLFDLTGSSALVVGAGGDLGRRAALVLGARGATIYTADHATASADLNPLLCDVTDEESVTAAVADASVEHGLDVVVNAAGVMVRKPVGETTLAEWRHVLDVNLTGTWLLNRAAAVPMSEQAHGCIVNISSVYAERVGPVPESAYYASKAGVANLTRSMASELGRLGVRVNCLALGVFYPTNMTAPLKDDPGTLAWFEDRTLLKRLGDPARDLDGPLLLLASEASSYMTGQVIYVDGGWSAW